MNHRTLERLFGVDYVSPRMRWERDRINHQFPNQGGHDSNYRQAPDSYYRGR